MKIPFYKVLHFNFVFKVFFISYLTYFTKSEVLISQNKFFIFVQINYPMIIYQKLKAKIVVYENIILSNKILLIILVVSVNFICGGFLGFQLGINGVG